ncbi:hypothetical protein GS491_26175 [Rhodococcus hoagii]|uniref:hypothetical protein n=1 Tax=Rhodococcus hoagii TaxID=43767 RepID=UPI001A08614F|nr:hypothetical protein [Prescottella equi]NKR80613.1 hypothetical protein [Prescottella equi]NKS99455.1 hypothetical protein [Prescottella equi]
MRKSVLGIAVTAVAVGALAGGIASAEPASTQRESFPDGFYSVGIEAASIAPGTYVTEGKEGARDHETSCSWTILDQDFAEPNKIVTTGVIYDPDVPVTIVISEGDDTFLTMGCKPWKLVEVPKPTGSTDLGPIFGS